MSEYSERLRGLAKSSGSESKDDVVVLFIDLLNETADHIETLEAKVKALESQKKKAFWHAFEKAVCFPENKNIQKAWEAYLNWEELNLTI